MDKAIDPMENHAQAHPRKKRRTKSSLEVVDAVRSLMLDELYSDQQQQRYIKRQVVQRLLGVLTAARASGMSWEEMAEVCYRAGLEIAPTTLKSYYFDLKEERDSEHVRQAATEIIKSKQQQAIKRELVVGASEDLNARRRADKRLASTPKLLSSNEAIKRTPPLPTAEKPAPTESQPQSAIMHNRPPAEPKTRSAASPPAPASNSPVAFPTFQPLEEGLGKHIDQLKAESVTVEKAVPVYEDLVLGKNGRVYFSTGEPFVGNLSPRQVAILELQKKYLKNASSDARSSSSVVDMPRKL